MEYCIITPAWTVSLILSLIFLHLVFVFSFLSCAFVYLCLCLLCYLFCFSSSVPGRSCPRRSPDHSYYLIGFLLFLYLLLIVFSAQCSVYLRTVFVTVLCQFVLFAVSSLSSLQNLSQSLCLLVFLFLFMFVL